MTLLFPIQVIILFDLIILSVLKGMVFACITKTPSKKSKKKDAKQSTTNRFWDYFTIWGNRFSYLTHFRVPNISILSCVFIMGYVVNHFDTHKLTFARQKSTLWIKQKKSNFDIDETFRALKWLLGCFQPITLKNDWMLIILCFSNWIERFSNLLRLKFAFKFT